MIRVAAATKLGHLKTRRALALIGRFTISSLAALTMVAPPLFASAVGYVREQRSVNVAGVTETWRLVWAGKPSSSCGPEDVSTAITCPCSGFAYGEAGKLSLVRRRGDHEIERLDLGTYFEDEENPGWNDPPGRSYLQRWPIYSGDVIREIDGDKRLISDIKHRPESKAMAPADYDRDGWPTKFLLQVGTLPCGKEQFIAIGVSRRNPHLHALSSMAAPSRPLVLSLGAWRALLGGPGDHIVPTWRCGDHGSEEFSDVVVSADNGIIRVRDRTFSCTDKGERGKLLKEIVQ
jgi:hypothetical protein